MRILMVPSVIAGLIGLHLCACVDDSASDDDCAGAPFGGGYTLSPGPAIHDGYYTTIECARICDLHDRCAPVIEQREQPRYRCGDPPPAHCGPRHMPRPNVRGPCDSDGFDAVVEPPPGATSTALECGAICGPFVSECRPLTTREDGRVVVRCGQALPDGCDGPDQAEIPARE